MPRAWRYRLASVVEREREAERDADAERATQWWTELCMDTEGDAAAAGAEELTPQPCILDDAGVEQALASGQLVCLGALKDMDADVLQELLEQSEQKMDWLQEELGRVTGSLADALAASMAHKQEAAEATDFLKQARQVQGMYKKKLQENRTVCAGLERQVEQQTERVATAENLLRQSAAQLAASVEKAKTEEEARKWAEGESEGLRVTLADLRKKAAEATKLVEQARQEGAKTREQNNATIKELRAKIKELGRAATTAQELKNQSVVQIKREQTARMEGQKRLDAMTAVVALRVTNPHSTKCVYCLEELATHTMVQCGHMILCKACADDFVKSKKTDCYVCKTPFDKHTVRPVVQVYACEGDKADEEEDPDAWFHDSLLY